MTAAILNRRPLPSTFAGRLWMPLEYVDDLEKLVREDMADKAALRGFMATIGELYQSIPEKFAKAKWSKSADAFRKHALIKTGWYSSDSYVFATKRDAIFAASRIGYMARMGHGYAITSLEGNTVHCFVPLSQSLSKMGKEDFTASKQDVLNWCCGIVGVSPADLAPPNKRNAA